MVGGALVEWAWLCKSRGGNVEGGRWESGRGYVNDEDVWQRKGAW